MTRELTINISATVDYADQDDIKADAATTMLLEGEPYELAQLVLSAMSVDEKFRHIVIDAVVLYFGGVRLNESDKNEIQT